MRLRASAVALLVGLVGVAPIAHPDRASGQSRPFDELPVLRGNYGSYPGNPTVTYAVGSQGVERVLRRFEGSWSPDGRWIASSAHGRATLIDSTNFAAVRSGARVRLGGWSPDGRFVAATTPRGQVRVFSVGQNGRLAVARRVNLGWQAIGAEWIDGRTLLVTREHGGRRSLYRVPLGGRARIVLRTLDDRFPISPLGAARGTVLYTMRNQVRLRLAGDRDVAISRARSGPPPADILADGTVLVVHGHSEGDLSTGGTLLRINPSSGSRVVLAHGVRGLAVHINASGAASVLVSRFVSAEDGEMILVASRVDLATGSITDLARMGDPEGTPSRGFVPRLIAGPADRPAFIETPYAHGG